MTHLGTSDQLLRNAALQWLGEQVQKFGDVLPASMLQAGFEFRNRQVPIISQQGIFRPQGFEVPLSIRTGVNSPYSDAETDESRVSEVLNRKRKLNLSMIRKLSTTLHIPTSVLVQEY